MGKQTTKIEIKKISLNDVKKRLQDEVNTYGTEETAQFAKSLLCYIENTEVITIRGE